MQAKDRVEKEKADAKNAVEEYVYYMRDKLADVFAEFISNEVRFCKFINLKIYRSLLVCNVTQIQRHIDVCC